MPDEVKLNKKEQKLFDAIEWDIEATLRGSGSSIMRIPLSTSHRGETHSAPRNPCLTMGI